MPGPESSGQEIVARRARICGRVQGVAFRYYTRAEADRLGVRGHVRNEPDRSVSLHAEGFVEQVDALLQWCQQGPPAARVESVDAEDVEPEGYDGFEILR